MMAILALHLLTAAVSPEAGERVAAPPVAPSEPAPMEWYGWKVLSADVLTFTVGLVAAGRSSWSLRDTSWVVPVTLVSLTYLSASPILFHLMAHQNGQAAVVDVLIRLIAPAAGALAGYGIALGTRNPAIPSSALPGYHWTGLFFGTLGALAFDAAVLAWAPRRADAARPSPRAALQWAPVAGVVGGAPFAGVAGAF